MLTKERLHRNIPPLSTKVPGELHVLSKFDYNIPYFVTCCFRLEGLVTKIPGFVIAEILSALGKGLLLTFLHMSLVSAGTACPANASSKRNSGGRKVFTREEWEQRLSEAPVSKKQVNDLVMNYLIIEGHKEAAQCFSEEASVDPGIDLNTIGDRMATRMAVESGDIEGAMARANEMNPLILDENDSLFFHLQQQKLIELIRQGKVDAALDFAQEELAPRGEENREFLRELERTMTLLAFDDASKSPVSDLLSAAQRQKTASELNAAILNSQCQEKEPKLPAALKMLVWAQKELKKEVSFPTMDIATASLDDPPDSPPPS